MRSPESIAGGAGLGNTVHSFQAQPAPCPAALCASQTRSRLLKIRTAAPAATAATSSGIVNSRESRVLPQRNRDCRRQPKETGKSRRSVPRKHLKLFGKTRS
ncbi:hypothetical protein NDU88_002622 [Pleurodeles waltl]|uniref:Uncharacterized protein n=1 Tax=Pleurodeles waltl TaxID=8319 RepID=A0AAV7LD13_PLEWA|nr:hypothetical protein NDU88_002622 [Pleurodeles waltl]